MFPLNGKPTFTMKTALALLLAGLIASAATAQRSRPAAALQPIGISQSTTHEFPESLARIYPNGGEARLLVTIRADGELTEWLVTGYSAAPFKQEAVAALKELKFAPARLNGETITARTEIVLRFETRGMLISTSTPEEAYNSLARQALEGHLVYRAFPVAALDRVPAALRTVTPRYPKELSDRGVAGSMTVDFYIDEDGVVRMPSVLEPEQFALGDLAVNALRQWKFESPVRGGKPVLAQAQQVFHFGEGPSTAAPR
jgi:TonB family protein